MPRGGNNVGIPFTIRTRAKELLADGEWHDYEGLLREVAKLVPPGIAMRFGEYRRIKGGAPPDRVFPADSAQRIRDGKRAYAHEAMRDKLHSFEIKPPAIPGRGPRLKRQIRLNPDRKRA